MNIKCDICNKNVKIVGKVRNVKVDGVKLMACLNCRTRYKEKYNIKNIAFENKSSIDTLFRNQNEMIKRIRKLEKKNKIKITREIIV